MFYDCYDYMETTLNSNLGIIFRIFFVRMYFINLRVETLKMRKYTEFFNQCIQQSLLRHKLVYNGGFQTLTAVTRSKFNLCGPNFAWP